jgi:hypothetical protein
VKTLARRSGRTTGSAVPLNLFEGAGYGPGCGALEAPHNRRVAVARKARLAILIDGEVVPTHERMFPYAPDVRPP